jgi:short-subunit dehydrogenase
MRGRQLMLPANGTERNQENVTSVICNFRKRGAIINLSSGAAHLPTPLITVYAATKVQSQPKSLKFS